ncbi:MAG: metal ABC transporter permease [Phycisphaeraceae bacterium]|nr:metal ABC transporter permease [Phycisphaeraceae bacterium]
MIGDEFLAIMLPAMLAGALAGLSCALIGCFLVLRRMSLMGDAIAHAVLPGLVLAYLVTGTTSSLAMLAGAACVALVTTALIELVHKAARVEESAAMGVVFVTLFAIGVLLLERYAGSRIHLDADCVLYGQIEGILWFDAPSLATLPREVRTLGLVSALTLGFVVALFKELRITSFDPALARTLGFRSGLVRYALMSMTAIVCVASFEAVGSIVVIAMLIVPAMIARLLTDRLAPMLALSGLIAVALGALGVYASHAAPAAMGFEHSVSAAGGIGVLLGLALAAGVAFSPRSGMVSRAVRRARLSVRVRREDMLAALHRSGERGQATLSRGALIDRAGDGWRARLALRSMRARAEIDGSDSGFSLTERGASRARDLVRSHRLWESYLAERVDLPTDHLHSPAERLEHVTDDAMRDELARRTGSPPTDPHGSSIP